ncbi:hypothetical protein ABIC63_005638 [Pseudacidovorax sp. 1753]|uniref:DUF4224 domain-containing protein n=1 Tax=Pseudacidovorax sp. 1753 TaxID=3156419 RepID=UPI003392BB0E
MSDRPDLSDEEVNEICAGLKQNAAKVNYLRQLGLRVLRRPNGRPLVARDDWQRVWASHNSRTAPTRSIANGPRWRVAAGG